MTPEQIRAARGWLNWSQKELAIRAGCAGATISNIEKGGSKWTVGGTMLAIHAAFGEAGVVPIDDGIMFDRKKTNAKS